MPTYVNETNLLAVGTQLPFTYSRMLGELVGAYAATVATLRAGRAAGAGGPPTASLIQAFQLCIYDA